METKSRSDIIFSSNSQSEKCNLSAYQIIEQFFVQAHGLKKPSKNQFELFEALKNLTTKLLIVGSKNRMRLKDARTTLKTIKSFIKTREIEDFILLKLCLFDLDDYPFLQNTDETTQNSLKLMNEIREKYIPFAGRNEATKLTYGRMDQISSSKLFENQIKVLKKLTQGKTNLCVTFAAMRLLSYTTIEFIRNLFAKNAENFDEKILNDLENNILNFDNNTWFLDQASESSSPFILQLITICCGVISPRSLNGLNHCNLDNQFQIKAQEQDIRT